MMGVAAAAHRALQARRDAPIQQQYVKSDLDFLGGFDAGVAWVSEYAERERAAFQMGYQAGQTDERMRQWRAQASGPASEETEPSPSALVANAGEV